MFKKLLVILLAVLAFAPLGVVLTGCEQPDEINVKRSTTVEDMPVGEPKTVVK